MVSRRLIEALRLHTQPMYEIAWLAEIHPSTLSQILNGIVRVRQGDARVLRVGSILGIAPEDCFEPAEARTGRGHAE